jgi:hypothetical protein
MSQVLTNLLSEVENLNSLDELFTLQERVMSRIRTVTTAPNGNGHAHTSSEIEKPEVEVRRVVIPGSYQRSQEEIEAVTARLRAKLSPEDQEKFDNVDLTKIDFGDKPITQTLIEMRQEERY